MQLLIQLEDNRLIETVGIPVEDERGSMRLTACVSSQVVLSHNFLAYENFYIEAWILLYDYALLFIIAWLT